MQGNENMYFEMVPQSQSVQQDTYLAVPSAPYPQSMPPQQFPPCQATYPISPQNMRFDDGRPLAVTSLVTGIATPFVFFFLAEIIDYDYLAVPVVVLFLLIILSAIFAFAARRKWKHCFGSSIKMPASYTAALILPFVWVGCAIMAVITIWVLSIFFRAALIGIGDFMSGLAGIG